MLFFHFTIDSFVISFFLLILSYLHLFGWVKSTARCSAILSANSLFIIVPILLLRNIRCITLLFAAYVKEFYFSQLNILRHHHINFFSSSLCCFYLMFFYNSLNKYVVSNKMGKNYFFFGISRGIIRKNCSTNLKS